MRTYLTTVAAVCLAWVAASDGVELRSQGLTVEARPDGTGIRLRMVDAAGVEYAKGLARYEFELKGMPVAKLEAQIAPEHPDAMVVNASGAGIELQHEIRVQPDGSGFVEHIRLRNTTNTPVEIADYRVGLRRESTAAGTLRAVAVPFRRQADGRLRDWSLDEIAADKAANSDFHNDPAVRVPVPVDTERGRLRSEGWVLTDGQRGLLVAKYNNDHIEMSMLDWTAGPKAAWTLGGSSFALHDEPEVMQRLLPGEWVTLGDTYYLPVDGGWQAGYERFRKLLNELGHGLTASYNPPVNWNELFDVGWYHSDRAALTQHWTRDALLKEAAKAKAVGAGLLYLDPGWEVCEGTSLWDEARLGSVAALAKELHDRFGLQLGFRTIGRVYRDEFPHEWYVQHTPKVGPYERPLLNAPAQPEPVPTTGPKGERNLALLPAAKASASSTVAGFDIHKAEHLNDGWYNNPASWVSAGEPSWAQIDLGDEYTIGRVCLGSEHTPHHRDRAATKLRILTATEYAEQSSDARWQVAAESGDKPVATTTSFEFAPRAARYVRVEILASSGGEARIDEIEVYEAEPHAWAESPRRRSIDTTQPTGTPINFWEVCTLDPAWQKEKLERLSKIVPQGMRFAMFDEFDWRGPCYCPDHGHAVPSTPEGHVRAIYGLIKQVKQRVPELLVEAHDPVWPWGVRYLPVYWGQTLDPAKKPGYYEENWGFEFMWNPIEDLLSGRAMCLYYYNLACDIPLYDHITMENDNDAGLAFWWYASTVRHLGIGGKKGLGGKQENETRWQTYQAAMRDYVRLRDWLVRGHFIGIDELDHLHVLEGRPGGVLVAFNLEEKPQERTVRIKPSDIGLTADSALPAIEGGRGQWRDGLLEVQLTLGPRSPRIVEIGGAAGAR